MTDKDAVDKIGDIAATDPYDTSNQGEANQKYLAEGKEEEAEETATTDDKDEQEVVVIHGESPLIDWPPPGYTADEIVISGLVDAGMVSSLTSHYFSSYNDILMDSLTD